MLDAHEYELLEPRLYIHLTRLWCLPGVAGSLDESGPYIQQCRASKPEHPVWQAQESSGITFQPDKLQKPYQTPQKVHQAQYLNKRSLKWY